MSGYCAIGSTRMATSPESRITIETTVAKIDRSMQISTLLNRLRRSCGGLCCRRCGWDIFDRSYFFAGANANNAVDDDLFAGVEAFRNDPVQPDLLTQSDGPNFSDVIDANDVDKRSLRALAYCFFCNCNRVEQGDAKDAQADELAWKQEAVRIWEDHAPLDGARVRIDSRSGRIDPASMSVWAAIAVLQLDRHVFLGYRFCPPFVELA